MAGEIANAIIATLGGTTSTTETMRVSGLAMVDASTPMEIETAAAAVSTYQFGMSYSSAIAVGADASDGAAITRMFNIVTGADGATGVVLPELLVQDYSVPFVIYNDSATSILKVWGNTTGTDDTINGLTHMLVPPKATATFYPLAASAWYGSYTRTNSGMWADAPAYNQTYQSVAHEYYNDFMLVAADYDVTNDFALTEDDAACTQAVTADATCGELLLTNKAATDDNAQQIILSQQSFAIAAGKRLWYEIKFKTAAGATQIDWSTGVIDAEDMTGVADNYPANGIVLSKLDGATTMILSSSDNGSDTVNAASGTWNTSYHVVGFYFNGGASGVGTIQAYFDGVALGNSVVCTYATMSKVAPFFMVRNGDGVTTQTATIDYIKCVQLR